MTFEPIIENNVCVNGCLPATDNDFELCESLEVSGRSIDFGTVWEQGEMPIVQYDAAFIEFLNSRKKLLDEIRGIGKQCLLPWMVLRALPNEWKWSNRLYFSQGRLPSCMGHADAFAAHSTTLVNIGLGHGIVYESFNPLVTWASTKKDSLRGGQSVSEMAKGANKTGHFPESLVGKNNQTLPNYKPFLDTAKRYQAALAFIPGTGKDLANEIVACCAAGLSVALGNSTAVNGAKYDKNGVKVATLRGSWAHATHFTAYRVVNGTEYIGWINSHGSIYGVSDEGEPADMCWMDRVTLEKFVATASGYGKPYAVMPESIQNPNPPRIAIPYPKTWRR